MHICLPCSTVEVAAEIESSNRRQLAELQEQMRIYSFLCAALALCHHLHAVRTCACAVMSVRQVRCLAQASVADLKLVQLHEEEPRTLIHRNFCDSRKSCELLLLRQLQGATLRQQV